MIHYAIDSWCCSYIPACMLEVVVEDEEGDYFSRDEAKTTCKECLAQLEEWRAESEKLVELGRRAEPIGD